MLRIGVIGFGYWGPNLVRNFHNAPETEVTCISDLAPHRLEAARSMYPAITLTTDHAELIARSDVDAVAMATPVHTHYALARAALEAGKHVFVEKPLTQTVAQATELIELAASKQLQIMVDHTFIYTGAVRKMRELVDSGDLGDIYYYDSVRVNLGMFQPDVSVLWDLAVHDLAILGYVLPRSPVAVSATGMAHVRGKPMNVAYMTLYYTDSLIAHIHVNWLSPVKVRQTLLGGSRKMVVYDDMEPSEKVKIYDRGITLDSRESIYETMVDYRMGDMLAPHLNPTEALLSEATAFAHCVNTGIAPANDGIAGLKVVAILEAATRSIEQRGAPVDIPLIDIPLIDVRPINIPPIDGRQK